MAIRLSKSFGSTPETWLGMQMVYDLWQARDLAEDATRRTTRRPMTYVVVVFSIVA